MENKCEERRRNAFKEKIRNYKEKQSLIKAALSNGTASNTSNRITFDSDSDNEQKNGITSTKERTLFESSDESENENIDFKVKKQFEGVKGQKLFELQQRFKDTRFTLDENFLDDEEESNIQGTENNFHVDNQDDKDSLSNEKTKDLEILSQVIGKEVRPMKKFNFSEQRRKMLRYDPENEEHIQYEIRSENKPDKTYEEEKNNRNEVSEETETENNVPVVSKDVYYDVTDELKEAFKENKSTFKLQNILGDPEDNEDDKPLEDEDNSEPSVFTNKKVISFSNPFKYDSSDDEDQLDQIPAPTEALCKRLEPIKRDPFFFKKDDYRLQDGHDFLIRMAASKAENFSKTRKELKRIVKLKVKNNTRNNRPFKKKLGNGGRKKRLKIKKALNK